MKRLRSERPASEEGKHSGSRRSERFIATDFINFIHRNIERNWLKSGQ